MNARPLSAHPPALAAATLSTASGHPLFEDPALAVNVFPLVREHPSTVAAILLPDQLHWLLSDVGDVEGTLDRFRSASTLRAWSAGWEGELWHPEALILPAPAAAARALLANAVTGGHGSRWRDYPWSCRRPVGDSLSATCCAGSVRRPGRALR